MFNEFNNILKKWADQTANKNLSIQSIIQFGSTCAEPIKKQTDIDLIYILDLKEKPNRKQSFDLTNEWEKSLESELKIFEGHNLIINSHVKIISQLDHLSPMYLDFLTRGKILFDRTDEAKKLFKNIENWIKRNGAHRVERGALWYWVYDDKHPNLPVDFRF
jgi:predicted nucleotidyltransferase